MSYFKTINNGKYQRTNLNKIKKMVTLHPRVKEAIRNIPPKDSFRTHISAISQIDQPSFHNCGIVFENIAKDVKGNYKLLIRQFEKNNQKGIESLFKPFISKPIEVVIADGTSFSKIKQAFDKFVRGQLSTEALKKTLRTLK